MNILFLNGLNNSPYLCGKNGMTQSYYYYKRLDDLLATFANRKGGSILKVDLFNKAPEEFGMALSFLVAEGCLEESKYGFQITYKGKAVIKQGGFVRKYRRDCLLFYSSIIGTIAGVLGLLISVVALLC